MPRAPTTFARPVLSIVLRRSFEPERPARDRPVMQKAKKRNDGSLFIKVCESFDSPNYLAITTKKGSLRATEPHVGIIGHGTKRYINHVTDLTDIAGGFWNRFLFVWSTMTQAILDAKVTEKLLADFRASALTTIKFVAGVQEMTRTPEAQRLMEVAYYKSIALAEHGLLGELLARYIPIVNRLSMIFALTDCSKVIGVEHVKAALALWEYSVNSTRLIFSDKLGGFEDKVLQMLRKHPEGLTRTTIWKDVDKSREKAAEGLRSFPALVQASRLAGISR